MMPPQQLEALAQERLRDWEREVKLRKLRAELPQRVPRLRRWLGNALVWLGAALMRGGEWLAKPQRKEGILVG